ncbi:AAA family ATPase [Streptomyces sp. RB6PN25]|uniref:AAA family ATPase n=1 Tax=Streptomyces humicola TaxID=2953240 RepID=A0ABT1PN35_9ACTN|nr:AAA family ATPase [Streptomyces humicola]MCQ4079086.1 AAA family ATPase [Streptomyces humicola]
MTPAYGTYGRFIQQIRLASGVDHSRYPFSLPAVRQLACSGALALAPGVTFLVGENGAGKSTLIEAIAVAAGFNPEGGSRNFRFATRATESVLGDHLILTRGIRKPRTDFFLRAESYYNVASEIERLHRAGGPPLLRAYGGVSPHERSHGQSFLDLATHRFGPEGLYLLDEPEAALSVQSCLALLSRMHELVEQGSQFLVATHSPILLALPGATIMEISDEGTLEQVDFDQALPVRLTREFLGAPGRFLNNLLGTGEINGTQGSWH